MKKYAPPRGTLWLLELLLKEAYLEQIEGDLYELFERDGAKRKARIKFTWNALQFFRIRYLKGLNDFEQLTTLAVINNYLKVAIRTLLKQKSFALINIGGLAIALASFMLISMYVLHERSYDNFRSDRIYRVANGEYGRWTPFLLAETAKAEIPQVEVATKINGLSEALIEVNGKIVKEPGGAWVGKNFLQVFDIDLIEGSKDYALSESNHVVLTQRLVQKYFPSGSPISEVIQIDNESYTVVGVIKDQRKNTHLPFTYLVANHVDPNQEYHWSGNNTFTYVKLKEQANLSETRMQFENLYAQYVAPDVIEYTGHATFDDLINEYPDRKFAFLLTSIKDVHLEKPYFSLGDRGDKENILIFSLIAIFILLIASVNYVNMSIAKSASRSKEVGIRKALGSQKGNIIGQFLTESLLITFIAVLLAYLIGLLSLTLFNSITVRQFNSSDLISFSTLLISIGLVIIVGLLAGSYPAYLTSKYNPIESLKGGIKNKQKSILRSGLVAFQFATSVFLIAVTYIIYSQVQHMKSQDIGISTEQTLVVDNGMELEGKYDVLKKQLESLPSIKKVSKMSHVPFFGMPDYTYSIPSEAGKSVSPMNTFMAPGAEEILDLQLLKGRFFKENLATDTSSVIINEALANELGLAEPLNKIVSRGNGLDFKIIGVIKDFNFQSLRSEIDPLIIRYGNASMEIGPYHQRYVLVDFNTTDINAVNQVADIWDDLVPKYPFEAQFLDEAFQSVFDSEKRFLKIFTIFSVLAILIAFLGIFALTTFVLQKRFKEIAVRKVLGASVFSILKMISKEFTVLVIVGGMVGLAGAFYWLQNWLNEFNYRINLEWYYLALPLLFILVLTWIIVSSRSYLAALSNPSNALKEE